MSIAEHGRGLARTVVAFHRLPSDSKATVLLAVGTVLIVQFLLTVASFRFVRTVLHRSTSHRIWPGRGIGDDIDRCVWAIETACRSIPGGSCLTKALAGQVLLQLNGHDTVLRVGIRLEGHELKAHSWVERRGEIILGHTADFDEYEPLPEFEVI